MIGLAWWALGFPFMKRYSKAYLEKHPEKKGKDLETTRKTCDKFRHNPVGIFNFVEGTRFTEGKHAQQKSPFKHLLKPKAGGIAFVLDAMGEQLEAIVNVTIHYPAGRPGYWDLLCGNVKDVVVHFQELKIPPQFIGKNYDQDGEYRLQFQGWINQLWQDKDALLAQMHREYPAKSLSSCWERACSRQAVCQTTCRCCDDSDPLSRASLLAHGDHQGTKKPADDHSSAGFLLTANA